MWLWKLKVKGQSKVYQYKPAIYYHAAYGLPDDPQSGGEGYHTPSRQKRIRTSFKHHQLRILKAYFLCNQNPDSKDLKQLAQKTGLIKRVLQVYHMLAMSQSLHYHRECAWSLHSRTETHHRLHGMSCNHSLRTDTPSFSFISSSRETTKLLRMQNVHFLNSHMFLTFHTWHCCTFFLQAWTPTIPTTQTHSSSTDETWLSRRGWGRPSSTTNWGQWRPTSRSTTTPMPRTWNSCLRKLDYQRKCCKYVDLYTEWKYMYCDGTVVSMLVVSSHVCSLGAGCIHW